MNIFAISNKAITPKILDRKMPDGSTKYSVLLSNGTEKECESLPHARLVFTKATSKKKRG